MNSKFQQQFYANVLENKKFYFIAEIIFYDLWFLLDRLFDLSIAVL